MSHQSQPPPQSCNFLTRNRRSEEEKRRRSGGAGKRQPVNALAEYANNGMKCSLVNSQGAAEDGLTRREDIHPSIIQRWWTVGRGKVSPVALKMNETQLPQRQYVSFLYHGASYINLFSSHLDSSRPHTCTTVINRLMGEPPWPLFGGDAYWTAGANFQFKYLPIRFWVTSKKCTLFSQLDGGFSVSQ